MITNTDVDCFHFVQSVTIQPQEDLIILKMAEGNPKWQDIWRVIGDTTDTEELSDQLMNTYVRELKLKSSVALFFRENLASWIEGIDCKARFTICRNSEDTRKRSASILDELLIQDQCSQSLLLHTCCKGLKKQFANNPSEFVDAMCRCILSECQMITELTTQQLTQLDVIGAHEEVMENPEEKPAEPTLELLLHALACHDAAIGQEDFGDDSNEAFQNFFEILVRWHGKIDSEWGKVRDGIESWELQLRCPEMMTSPMRIEILQESFSQLFEEIYEGLKNLITPLMNKNKEIEEQIYQVIGISQEMLNRSFVYISQPDNTLKCSGGSYTIKGISVELRWLLCSDVVCKQFQIRCTGYDLVYANQHADKPIAKPKKEFKGEPISSATGRHTMNDVVLKYEKKRVVPLMESLCVFRTKMRLEFNKELLSLSKFWSLDIACNTGLMIVTSHPSQYEDALAALTWDVCSGGRGTAESIHWSNLSKQLNWLYKERCGTETKRRGLDDRQLNFLKSKIPDIDDQSEDPSISWDQFYRKDEMKRHQNFQQDSVSFWGWFYATLYLVQECLTDIWNDGLIAGYISKVDAEKILANLPEGSFMLRFSESYVKYSPSYPHSALSAIFVHRTKNHITKAISADPYYFEELKNARKANCFGSLLQTLTLIYEGEVISRPLKVLIDHNLINHPCQLEEAFQKYLCPLGELDGYIQRVSQKLLDRDDGQQGVAQRDTQSVRSTSMSPQSNPSPLDFMMMQHSPLAAVPSTVNEYDLQREGIFVPDATDPLFNKNNSNNMTFEDELVNVLDEYQEEFIENELGTNERLALNFFQEFSLNA
ncbi:uncharacterized protein LOC141909332 isoform X2 [Tubulanus polymorphus]|uniref:uncharacterized protein LOC141909332 isoform X2 n=1 Tax=Tubulanus polymorphus TaxID=672921 RepID=UPI003DA42CFD